MPHSASDAPRGDEWAPAILALGRQLQRHWNRQLRQQGLSESHVATLRAVAAGVESQTGVAEQTGLSPAQVSGLIEQLRRSGLVVGSRAEDDRRRQQWQLTPAGQHRLRCCQQLLDSWLSQFEPPPPMAVGALLRLREELQHPEVSSCPSEADPNLPDEEEAA